MKEIILRHIKGVNLSKPFTAKILGGGRGFGHALAMETYSNEISPTLRTISGFVVVATPIENNNPNIQKIMKKERTMDFHKYVRVVYRACRKLYGKEQTQDECLRVFKVVFPQKYKLEHSEEPMANVPSDVSERLTKIFSKWNAYGELAKLVGRVQSFLDLQIEVNRTDLIRFYDDICPVVMRIRKLTPRECFRLMGVSETDIDTILGSGISQSAAYKLAGNSIVAGGNYKDEDGNVDGVLYNLFRTMFVDTEESADAGQQLMLF